MSVESHTADGFAKECLHLPEPVRRAVMEFARRAVCSKPKIPPSGACGRVATVTSWTGMAS